MLDNAYNFLYGKLIAIDWQFGLSQYSDYQQKLELVKLGASLKEVFDGRPKCINFEIQCLTTGEYIKVNPTSLSEIESEIKKDSIVSMSLNGYMRSEDGMYSHGAQSYYEMFDRLSSNKKVRGAILKTKSGGGEAMAGMIWHDGIKEFRNSGKPLIAEVTEAGSSAYLGIAAATEIHAINDMAMSGSIGAVMNLDEKVLKFLKENNADIYSRKSPKKNKEIRMLIKGDASAMEDRLDEFVNLFHEKVISSRPLKGDITDTLEGDMFFARPSLERGLIDGIMSSKEIIKRIKTHI